MFEQRYAAPGSGNKFYINVDGGGFNRCIKVSGFSVLPNCTGYAWGRFMEECGRTSCNLSTGNAQNWYSYTADGYPRGQVPKLGAVMCWGAGSGKYGHVAIVEQINTDGSVIASMSNYPVDGKKLPYFDRVTYRPPYRSASRLPFQGFIYNPYITTDIPFGASDQERNGHKYSLYKQGDNETVAVLSAGLNQLSRIQDLNADVWVMAKATGANFFNNEPKDGDDVKNPDPFGTTYGDISAPLNEVWRELPNQNTTLYFDYETGAFGDCTGIHIDPAHNIASPAVIFPAKGNYQYARMIERNGDKGAAYLNSRSRFSFAIRTKDGRYIAGIALEELTPKEIADDWRTLPELESIQFFDGGGSAQFGRVNSEGKFEYVRTTPRKVPSAFAIISKTPYKPETKPTTDETQKDEDEPMDDEKTPETGGNEPTATPEPEPVPDWKDPEPQTGIITERIAALMSVKSILTLALTAVFAYLVIHQIAIPDLFNEIYKIVILFFFGYQTGKAQNGGGGK